MKILTHVDLGKAFESLKNSLIEIEKTTKEEKPTTFESGLKYANAYGRLSATVLCHIAGNTDTSYHFLDEALKTPPKAPEGYPEAPTLLLYAQTHWTEDDIPKSLFVAPGQFVGEDGIYTAPENQLHNPSNIHP